MLEYQNIKVFLQKDMFQGYVKGYVFVIEKVENTVLWTNVISVLRAKKLLERFMERNGKKQIKKSLELKK